MADQHNPPAFPSVCLNDPDHPASVPGMSLRDWFATFAPQPDGDRIAICERFDIARNPHNDSHKPARRTRAEIVAQIRYEHADAMLAERKRG